MELTSYYPIYSPVSTSLSGKGNAQVMIPKSNTSSTPNNSSLTFSQVTVEKISNCFSLGPNLLDLRHELFKLSNPFSKKILESPARNLCTAFSAALNVGQAANHYFISKLIQ